MIAEDERAGIAIAARVIDEAALEGEECIEFQRAEEVRAECSASRRGLVDGVCVVHRSPARVLEFIGHRRILAPVPPITQYGPASIGRLLRSPLALSVLVVGTNALKPVTVDDTAYLAFARQISSHPFDPYGFSLYWYAEPEPAFEILAPPIVPYWLALGIGLFGENVALLKVWLFPFVWLFAWAAGRLLQRFARGTQLLAVVVLSPAVLPAVNLMLDIPAVALGLTTVVLGVRAIDAGSYRLGMASGLVAAAAMQTKYTMLVIPPVVLWYGMVHGRFRLAALAAAIALGAFAGWEMLIAQNYGRSHFLHHATRETAEPGPESGRLERWVETKFNLAPGLTGHFGCLGLGAGLVAVGAVGVSRRLRGLIAAVWLSGFTLIAILPGRMSIEWDYIYWQSFGILWLSAVAACVVVLNFRVRKGLQVRAAPDSLFLAGWFILELGAYFVLTPFPAARRVIGLSVVSVLLAARACGRAGRIDSLRRPAGWTIAAAIGAGAAIAAIDILDAFPEKYCAERAARLIADRPTGSTVWYMGHWGFQYYCERAGMQALAQGKSALSPGDYLVLPVHPTTTGFHRPDLGTQPIELPLGTVEPVLGVGWDDRLAAQTVPNYYGGINPVVGRDHIRLRVVVYRVIRAWKPVAAQRR
jgi:hypothetical protein